jgi:hypothetical protein
MGGSPDVESQRLASTLSRLKFQRSTRHFMIHVASGYLFDLIPLAGS